MAATRRILGAVGGLVLAVGGVAGSGGSAGANESAPVSDVITFTSHVYLMPVTPGQPRRFVIVDDTCQLVSDGEPTIPCRLVLSGTVAPTGGQARGVITSSEGVITLDETFVFTGPTTSAGAGTAVEVDRDDGSVTFGTFTATFTTAPTSDPNVLLDTGTITVRD